MKKYQIFSSENFHSLVMKFSIYLNRPVFVMLCLGKAVRRDSGLSRVSSLIVLQQLTNNFQNPKKAT